MAGQVEVAAGQVNFRGSLTSSASNVLEPMLHPEGVLLLNRFLDAFFY